MVNHRSNCPPASCMNLVPRQMTKLRCHVYYSSIVQIIFLSWFTFQITWWFTSEMQEPWLQSLNRSRRDWACKNLKIWNQSKESKRAKPLQTKLFLSPHAPFNHYCNSTITCPSSQRMRRWHFWLAVWNQLFCVRLDLPSPRIFHSFMSPTHHNLKGETWWSPTWLLRCSALLSHVIVVSTSTALLHHSPL